MSSKFVLGISGNLTRPSKTRGFVDHIAGQVGKKIGASSATFDIQDLGPSFAYSKRLGDLDLSARNIVEQLLSAAVLVVGSPTFKGSYTGLFKHFFDLLEPSSLKGKPIILAATGGGERHSLVVEHQLRPLFGFFEALTIPTGSTRPTGTLPMASSYPKPSATARNKPQSKRVGWSQRRATSAWPARHCAAEKDGAGNLLATPPKSSQIIHSGKAPCSA